MHRLPLFLVVAVTLLTASSASAADSLCPDTVSVTQTGTSPAPEWSLSYSRAPSELEMVTFYNGPPKEEASLVYNDFVRGKDSSTATWKFPKDLRGYWVKCSYRGTSLELSKALPPTVSSCRVSYERQAASPSGLPAIKRIACQ
ncbi:MAG TPA: STY0301 family protein [Casimicrobiaceae bacterium]|jgi:hypothetical protein|nr:STY0301 family protein [Casimicrobiaceae bacterium]